MLSSKQLNCFHQSSGINMTAINPLEQCKADFDAYVVKYKSAVKETFGNNWSDAEIEKQLGNWYPMWQAAFADGMSYMQHLREDDALVLDDLQK
jgi:hypothetical protein